MHCAVCLFTSQLSVIFSGCCSFLGVYLFLWLEFAFVLLPSTSSVTAGPSRATAGPGETFSWGHQTFSRGPSGENILNFCSKWYNLAYFTFLAARRGPKRRETMGSLPPSYPTLSTGLGYRIRSCHFLTNTANFRRNF